ncbi:hypothetical protein DQ04_08651000 [Trypanosoma grayi]|uniref:hypothetical protein n=1 Tax=Trypanosoma grayi TaxID=71804 RepID=UPI0004F486C2|nr:hypothetical protein DQ04_08651000 [Trypanosoma grayi]KEG07847.1 hypothetical protein DQ04_08651000 [Trypanosoma grayi]
MPGIVWLLLPGVVPSERGCAVVAQQHCWRRAEAGAHRGATRRHGDGRARGDQQCGWDVLRPPRCSWPSGRPDADVRPASVAAASAGGCGPRHRLNAGALLGPELLLSPNGPHSGLYAHVWYATTYLRVLRLGFMYLTDVVYGDDEYAAAVRLLEDTWAARCLVWSQ